MSDISEISTSDLIEELARRCNDQLVMAYYYTEDGGDTATRFYMGSKYIVNLGLARALSLDAEQFYRNADPDEEIQD